MKKILTLLFILLFSVPALMGTPNELTVKGRVIDRNKRDGLPYIDVLVSGTTTGTVTDSLGNFIIENVPPGIFRLVISAIGYKTQITPEYILSTKDLYIPVELEETSALLKEVSVTGRPAAFRRIPESPVGLHIIGIREIEKSPGANRDISRIVQSYPGVAFSPVGYRNDLIVRGGGPGENRFYIDGVEIPNINHFSTQGASGGPVGIINADLIREVNFYTATFPANRGNVLSSVMDIRLRDGNPEKYSLKATVGASEISFASNGPITKKTTYQISVRQSYLQFLFKMLGLPLLPTFTDAQIKIKTRFTSRHELTWLALTGIDNMRLSKEEPKNEERAYTLGYLPRIRQRTFTLGAVYKHYSENHTQTLVVSHNFLNNQNTKYRNNDESTPENLMLKLRSTEQDTRLRLENQSVFGNWKIGIGGNLDYSQYRNKTFQQVFIRQEQHYDYRTDLGFLQGGLFVNLFYETSDERFSVAAGLRTDAAGYSDRTRRLDKQLSPRVALSWQIVSGIFFSGNFGRYFQLPPYTALGFKQNGRLANSELTYQQIDQTSIGIAWRKGERLQISAEFFYKKYDHLPFSVKDSIPLACKGNDYGVVGNEKLIPAAQGRAYGIEWLVQWQIPGKLNLYSSLTLFRSENRQGKEKNYIPSAWDNRFIFNVRGTWNFPRNWSAGAKISAIGGTPYTPYDVERSSLKTAWDAQAKPYYDYSRYNTRRTDAFGQLDIRIDKTFYLGKCLLGFYIDIQNITHSKLRQPDILVSTGETDPDDPARYRMKYISQDSGTIIPTLGITFEL